MGFPISARVARPYLIALLLIGLVILALPWLGAAWYAVGLMRMPAPTSLAMPVAGLKRTALTDTWHAARAPARRHEGIDIFAKKGTPVIASTEGLVIRRGENSLGGNVVWVLGPGGHHHYYAHLDQAANVEVGERVQAGTVLGHVGNTGNARTTPPHLHYGVYADEGPINPYPLLAAYRAVN
jgi:murein DD-endopeptidase MepM/ murein hydrolase activator NlpD